MTEQDYYYTQLASDSVRRMVVSQYDIGKVLSCKFYVLGLHDNYLIETETCKYIVRIYRNSWRSEEDIRFELEWIKFLNTKSNIVAKIIPSISENLTFQINSPEGLRFAVLFSYADGFAPGNALDVKQTKLLGKAIADIHNLSDSFEPQYSRPALDIPYLLDKSIRKISRYLDEDACVYLGDLRENLYTSMPELVNERHVYGLCLGDVNPTNFHINHEDKITVFDLDQCGYGYRSFEIGKFYSSIRNHSKQFELQDAFLQGYQTSRLLSQNERDAIPVFEIIAVIWVMSILVDNADRVGYKFLEKACWDKRITDLKKIEANWKNMYQK